MLRQAFTSNTIASCRYGMDAGDDAIKAQAGHVKVADRFSSHMELQCSCDDALSNAQGKCRTCKWHLLCLCQIELLTVWSCLAQAKRVWMLCMQLVEHTSAVKRVAHHPECSKFVFRQSFHFSYAQMGCWPFKGDGECVWLAAWRACDSALLLALSL